MGDQDVWGAAGAWDSGSMTAKDASCWDPLWSWRSCASRTSGAVSGFRSSVTVFVVTGSGGMISHS